MGLSKTDENLDQICLRDLARGFFEWKSFGVRESIPLQGNLGAYEFDFLLSQKEDMPSDALADFGVLVKDWARTCGVNVILQFEHIMKDMHPIIHQGMLIANQFSSSARALAEKAGVLLLSRGELISIYRTNQIPL
ncbi:MAG: restriction endonuclease [Candidatus Hodarchaeota archaeon]